jgi:cell wall-associated NlpC family hydrolase
MRTMWKRTCPIVLSLVLLTAVFADVRPASAIAAEPESITVQSAHSVLKIGSRGWQVTQLQQNLRTLGYFTFPRNTGYYGWITATAVKRFQRDYSLRQDGIAGPITKTAIKRAIVKKKIITDSTRYLGVKYVYGGESPSRGFDCSGFIHYMFTSHGVWSIPRTTAANLYRRGYPVSRRNLRPGDLVFFSIESRGTISHVGFYMGKNKFISATISKGVWIYPLDNSYWGPHYMGAKRVY